MISPAQAIEHWKTLDFAKAIEAEHISFFAEAAQTLTLRPGQTFVDESSRADGLFLLLDGEVSVSVSGKIVALVRAPKVLGLLSLIDGRAPSASLTAFTDATVLRLPCDAFEAMRDRSPAFADAMMRELSAELRRMYDNEARQLERFDDFFESPNAKLSAGPYVADAIDMWIFVMQGSARSLARLLPEGLSPIPGIADRYLLTFNFFDSVRSESPLARGKTFSYNETCPFIPCLGPRLTPAVFTPELYPDNLLAITLGREMYGFPKRFGRTERARDAIDLTLGRRLVLRASWESTQAASPEQYTKTMTELLGGTGPLPHIAAQTAGRALALLTEHDRLKHIRPKVPVFVHKQIVDESTETERILDVNELIEIPFEISSMNQFELVQGADVRFFDSSYFLDGRCVGALRTRLGFRFGKGTCWIDYGKGARDEGVLARISRRIAEGR